VPPQSNDRQSRIDRLRAKRADDAAELRDAALAAIEHLVQTDVTVTAKRVCQLANCSEHVVYKVADVRQAYEAARAKQRIADAAIPPPKGSTTKASNQSLAVDLRMSREDNQKLRAEIKNLRTRLSLARGAELEQVSSLDLIDRITRMENEHREMQQQLDQAALALQAVDAERDELAAELEGSRAALRRLMRDANVPVDGDSVLATRGDRLFER
jgi:hypothetical protein